MVVEGVELGISFGESEWELGYLVNLSCISF